MAMRSRTYVYIHTQFLKRVRLLHLVVNVDCDKRKTQSNNKKNGNS